MYPACSQKFGQVHKSIGSCKTFVNSAFGYFYLVQMEIACTNPGASVKVLLHAGAGMRSVVPASAPKLQNVIACKL